MTENINPFAFTKLKVGRSRLHRFFALIAIGITALIIILLLLPVIVMNDENISQSDALSESIDNLEPSIHSRPLYQPPRVHNQLLADFVDRRLSERVSADFHVRFPFLQHEKDLRAVASVLRDRYDNDAIRHEAAELLRRSQWPALLDELSSILDDPFEGERMREYVIQYYFLIAENSGPEAEQARFLLQERLDDQDAGVRRQALWALGRLNDAQAHQHAVASLYDDTQVDLWDIAIRIIQVLDDRSHLDRLRIVAAQGPTTLSRIAALNLLTAWEDVSAKSISIDILELPPRPENERLRNAATVSLHRLAQIEDERN